METTVVTAQKGDPIDLSVDVAQYFDVLRREQARFLDALGQATSLLGDEHSQVAGLGAVQGRLTRQFFDAQRLILQRRAETDAAVARIGAETEEHANTVLASAVAHAVAGQLAPPRLGVETDGPYDPMASDAALVEQSTRQAIAALGAMAMRTKVDAEAIEHVINDALAPTETDGARMERQMQQLLDEWWNAEAQEARALVDDARARAAMRLHLAHLEACEIVGAAAPVGASAPAPVPTLLPASVTEVLDRADANSLEGVFAALEQSLLAGSTPTVERAVTLSPRSASLPSVTPEHVESSERFQQFWHHEPQPPADERSLSLVDILRRIVFPMCAVTSALALALAWIG